MTFAYGPYTDVVGFNVTTASDGAGGLTLTCDKYGTLHVPAANLADPTTARLVERVMDGTDFETNYRNLCTQLGLPDPGVGNPAT